ncbi:MAG TPA: response regulator [Ktedonobacteraceae bacterium]|nr:response regulator [Ktedonobacteraceae bacterium]
MVVDWQKQAESDRLIAIVEDDAQLNNLFRDMLERDGRWCLHFFSDGQDAKDHLPELGAHLILLDVGLPNLDGVSLYKILRGHSKTRNTPIIVITGSHDWELQRMGLQTGLLLRKPFRVQELLFMIQAVLSTEVWDNQEAPQRNN